eukprot:7948386-Pyramimonas_sp.AAC.1
MAGSVSRALWPGGCRTPPAQGTAHEARPRGGEAVVITISPRCISVDLRPRPLACQVAQSVEVRGEEEAERH